MEINNKIDKNIDFILFVLAYVSLLISFFFRDTVFLPVFLGIAFLLFSSSLFVQFSRFTPRKRVEGLISLFLLLLIGLPFTYLYFENNWFSVEFNIVSLLLSTVFFVFIVLSAILSRFVSAKLTDRYNLSKYFDFE